MLHTKLPDCCFPSLTRPDRVQLSDADKAPGWRTEGFRLPDANRTNPPAFCVSCIRAAIGQNLLESIYGVIASGSLLTTGQAPALALDVSKPGETPAASLSTRRSRKYLPNRSNNLVKVFVRKRGMERQHDTGLA